MTAVAIAPERRTFPPDSDWNTNQPFPSEDEHDETQAIARQAADLFKLLADETRLRILLLLKERVELNVQTLCGLLEQTQPAVSHHLALLRVAGILQLRRSGKHNFYRLLPERFADIARTLKLFLPEGITLETSDRKNLQLG
jgi:DNA-binding transcriptional ArsR family regulator